MKISDDSRTGCAAVVGWSERTAGSGQSFVIARAGTGPGASIPRDHSGSPRIPCYKTAVYDTWCAAGMLATGDSSTYYRQLSKDLRFREVRRFQRHPDKIQQRPLGALGALGEGERVLAPHDPRPATVVSGDRDDPPRQAGLEITTPQILPSLLRRRWACSSRIRRLEGCNVTAAWQPERRR
jgi:hypothetical protein